MRLTGLNPSPCDTAVVRSILPTLADQAAIDWSQPLEAWSKDAPTLLLKVGAALFEPPADLSELSKGH